MLCSALFYYAKTQDRRWSKWFKVKENQSIHPNENILINLGIKLIVLHICVSFLSFFLYFLKNKLWQIKDVLFDHQIFRLIPVFAMPLRAEKRTRLKSEPQPA